MLRFMNELESKNYAQVQNMLKNGTVKCNQSYVGVFPLNMAIESGDPDMVAILLTAGAPPEAKGNRNIDKDATQLATAMRDDKKGKYRKEAAEILELLDSNAKDKKKLRERFEAVQLLVKKAEAKDLENTYMLLTFGVPVLAGIIYYLMYMAPPANLPTLK